MRREAPRIHFESRGAVVVDLDVGGGEVLVLRHVLSVGAVVLVEPADSGELQVPNVVRMVDHAHRIGLVEGNPVTNRGRRNTRRRFAGAAGHALARIIHEAAVLSASAVERS
jgi:hypothetical protein